MYGPLKPATATNPKVVTTRYVGQLYEEESIEGEVTPNRRTKFIYLGSQRLASNNNGEAMWYHSDHLGGTNVLTDRQGQARELTEYEPFGSIQRHEKYGADSATAWYYFTGKPIDDETGLMYYGARYYNPKLGRFITPDTIVQSPGNPQTLNRYTYCNNNPVNLIDPSGHSWKKFFQKVSSMFGVVGILVGAVVTGDYSNLGQKIAISVFSAAMTMLLPGSGTLASNFFMNVGMHVVRGAAIGAVTGGVSSMIMGGTFAQGARMGAIVGGITGGIQGVTTSEHFQNWQNGRGFKSNADIVAKINRQAQEAIGRAEPLPFSFGDENGVNGIGWGDVSDNGWMQKVNDFSSEAWESIKYEYQMNEGAIAAFLPQIKAASLSVGAASRVITNTGRLLNNNQYLRVGVGSGPLGKGGNWYFRISGEWVKKYGWTEQIREQGHIYLYDLGRK